MATALTEIVDETARVFDMMLAATDGRAFQNLADPDPMFALHHATSKRPDNEGEVSLDLGPERDPG